MIALNDPVPLRENLDWGTFGTAVYLPHRYGAVGGQLIQYDRARLNFVWADHFVESIDSVLVNGVQATDWTWANVIDVTGQAVAMVTFQQPVDLDVTLIARGKGKLHPRTGARMADPAAILWDLFANICGRDITESQLSQFSIACVLAGVEAAGSIESPDTAQTIARAICASVGALYCADAPGLAFLWPAVSQVPALATVDGTVGIVAAASAVLSGICNDYTIRYDFEGDSPRQSVQLEAPDSVKRYGRRTATLDAHWTSSTRTAVNVAQRVLQQSARAQWTVHVDGMKRRLQVGQGVSLEHPAIPATGTHQVLTRSLTLSSGLTSIDLSVPIGSVPATRILQQSEAFDPQTYASAGIQTVGSDRVITLTNSDGTPIANAQVTLDGTLTRQSDSSGRVSFPASAMPPGTHVLHIITADGRTLDSSVLVQ